MKKSLQSRLRRGLFPKTPQSFVDKVRAALPREQTVSERQDEEEPFEQENPRLRFLPILATAALGVVVAACLLFVIVGAIRGRKSNSKQSDIHPAASIPASELPSASPAPVDPVQLAAPTEQTVVGTWELWKIDYNGLLISASAFTAEQMKLTFFADGTVTETELYLSSGETGAYTFDGHTVTFSGGSLYLADGETAVYDPEADTLTMHREKDGDAKLVFRREQPKEPEKRTAIGTWSYASGVDYAQRLTIRSDGTATMRTKSNLGAVDTSLTYTEEDGALLFRGELLSRMSARYDAETDTLTVTIGMESAVYKRAIPELKGKWTLTEIETNGTKMSPAQLGVIFMAYLEFTKDGDLTATIRFNDEVDREEYRYFVNGTSIDIKTSDDTIRRDAIVYDAVTDTLRMNVEASHSSDFVVIGTLIFSRTPDAEIPALTTDTASDLAGMWTRTRSKYASQGTDYSWIDVDMESWQSWLEITADGHAHLTEYDSESGEALHADFSVAIGSGGIQTDWESCTGMWYDNAADTICMEIVGRRRDYYSRTPDAEIPEIKPDLVGKWTVTEVQMNGETVDPSMFGEKGGMWLELNPDGSAMLTGLNDVDGIEQGGQYTVTENTVVITDENGDPLTLTYDPATDTLFAEHIYSDYNLTLGLRFARTPDAEIPELPSEELTELKRLYPEYFGLDTTNGLKVYVWQMSSDGYSCALLAGSDNKTDAEIGGMRGITIEEMRLILNTYEIEDNDIDVEVVPFRNPLSSYWYEIDKAYTDNLIWLLIQVSENDIVDKEVFDVDGDGRLETCELSYGPTSGLFTVEFTVYRNGAIVYHNTFNMEYGYLQFICSDGKPWISHTVPQNDGMQLVKEYAITIEDGAIVLTDEQTGETVPYWNPDDPQWNMAVAKAKTPEELLEGVWCVMSAEKGQDGLLEIGFYYNEVADERMVKYREGEFVYDGYSYTVEKWEQSQRNSDNPWYRFILVDGNEELTIDLCMDMDGRNPLYMDWNVGEDEGGWKTYLKLSPIEADALPYQQREYYGAGEGFVGYLDVVDLNGDGNPVRVKVDSSDPNWWIDKGEEPELTVEIGRGKWTVNEVFVWDSLIYADLDPNDGHGNVLVSAKRADGTVVTYELHLEGDKVVCGHVAEGYCRMYAMSTDIYLCETAPLGGVDGERKISGETLVPESDWWTVPRYFYSSEKDRDWLVQHGQLLRLICDLPCEIDGESAVLEAGTYLYLSRYHESLDRIEFLTEDNRTVLVRPQAGLLLDGTAPYTVDGVPLADYFDNARQG